MSKEHIKNKLKNLKEPIDLTQFDTLAKNIAAHLNDDEFDKKKVQQTMAKYATIKNNKIIFNTKEKSNLEYKTINEKLNKKQETSFFDFNLKKDSKDSYYLNNKVNDKINNSVDDKHISKKENNLEKKIIKSVTKKTGGFSWENALASNNNDNDNNDNYNNNNIINNSINNSTDNQKLANINYEYSRDYHYIPKIRLEPFTSQSIYDQQKNDKLDDYAKMKSKIVEELMSREYPAQKSEAWHALRRERTTASDGGCVLHDNHNEPPHKFLYKKVMNPPFQSNINCYNGNKYEQIATMIYAYRMNVDVEEFGLIAHPKCRFLAASPDGIISPYKHDKQHLTNLVGRMLEIKCPTTRQIKTEGEIRGEICPVYYWDQVQLQLECCNLDECDFWQCKITEYSTREDFLEDTHPDEPFRSKSFGMEKGVVIQLMPKRLPNISDQFIKQLEEYKILLTDVIKCHDSEKKELLKTKLNDCLNNISLECNNFALICEKSKSDNDQLIELDKYIKYLLRGTTLKCEHCKSQYCNNWRVKDPNNCDYCEAVYAHSKHLYPPKIDMTPYEYDEWIHEVMTNYSDQKLLDPALNVEDYYIDRIIYWKLEKSHCVTIYRDKKWYNDVLPEIEKMWNYVEYFREHTEIATLFFEFVESLTIKSTFIKNKDEEMSHEEIERIMEVAKILCNDKSKNYSKKILEIKNEIKENLLNKEEKIKQKLQRFRKR